MTKFGINYSDTCQGVAGGHSYNNRQQKKKIDNVLNLLSNDRQCFALYGYKGI